MLGVLILISILLAVGVSLLWGRCSFAGLNFSHRLSRECAFFGERLVYSQEITNNKLLPLPWLMVETEVPSDVGFLKGRPSAHYKVKKRMLSALFSAMWYEKITKKYPILCENRGYYFFGPTRILSGDIFGFVKISMINNVLVKLVVYPRILDVKTESGENYSPAGSLVKKSFVFKDSYNVSGTRDYVPGDSIKSIDWKASARTARLIVREYDASFNRKAAVFLNINTYQFPWEGIDVNLLELSIMTAASVVNKAVSEGFDVMFLSNARVMSEDMDTELTTCIPYGRGISHLKVILESLARMHPFSMIALEDVMLKAYSRLKRDEKIICITPYLSERMTELLKFMALKGIDITLILTGNKDNNVKAFERIKTYRVAGEGNWREMEEIRLV